MLRNFLSTVFVVVLLGTAMGQNAAPDNRAKDREAVRAVVEKIFQAFVDKDAATLRATHADDWAGYFTNSKTLTTGIDGYMKQAGGTVNQKTYGMTSFKFDEFQVDFQGDLALVFYVAEIEGRNPSGQGHDKLRSLDVYAKRNGNWVQVASNLTRHPDSVADFAARPVPVNDQLRQRILGAREAVWRAWFTHDEAALEKAIPENVIASFQSNGKWLKRSDILAESKAFADSGIKLVRLEFPETEIQMYGSTITLYTTYVYETDKDGKRMTHTGRGIESFVLRGNDLFDTGWLLTSKA